jgi:hypothetical protein
MNVLVDLQCEFPRLSVVWIVQRKKKNFQNVVAFIAIVFVPALLVPLTHATYD